MRLIDTKTLALKEFFGNQIPRYAILSHTWHEEEVSFQDWADQSSASQKKGYKKIFDVCQLARKHGLDYVWVDTNCIDKSSSSELSEAINSMFKWYQLAQVCYVYLFDVPSREAASKASSSSKVNRRLNRPSRRPKTQEFSWYFHNSRWFTRGWTLQELLAPRHVEFYSNDWSLLGTKKSLGPEISSITRINIQYLCRKYVSDPYIGNPERGLIARSIQYGVPLWKSSVSERLSWVSNRTTTRLEDMAYCMLGIFGLNMPLLYGEGSKAFTRLQEEIMKVSDDHSLFCWTWNMPQNRGGFLSEVPSQFRYAGRFVPKQEDKRPAPYTFTNAGLSIRLPILHGWKSSFIGILRVDSFETGKIFGLPMSGDLTTGRVCRMPFPFEPIPLCDGVSGSQEFSVFVSENYSQQHGYEYESSVRSLISATEEATGAGKEAVVFLTFEPEGLVRGITTYPPNRFHPVQSSISIHVDEEEMGGWVPRIRFKHLQHTYEGVFIHLELQTGEFKAFMIASRYEKFLWGEDTPWRWHWHYWRVSSEDAATILSGELKEGAPVAERVLRAIKDPEYAQALDSQALQSETHQSHVSISIAKDYLRISNEEDIVIAHMHLAQLLSDP
jgi:(2Fe-2S) ferredoxin